MTTAIAAFDRLRLASLASADRLRDFVPLFARLVVGLVFTLSGFGKLQHLEKVVEYFRSLGIPAAELQAPFAAGTELVCGVLLLAGLATRLAAVPLIVVMLVALKTAFGAELGAAGGPLEFANTLFGLAEFLYVVLLAGLVIGGAGRWSLDRAFCARRG
ncbi:MAG: DoxX family protein [Planctomycetes bacterium]|nr:DoxX family protein [Planctomycetota bacterium]